MSVWGSCSDFPTNVGGYPFFNNMEVVMEEVFFVITLFLICMVSYHILKPSRSGNSQISIGGKSNKQVRIQSGSNCSISNINGRIEITGTVRSLTVNSKKIDLG